MGMTEADLPPAVRDWLLELHNKSEAKHGEVAVYKFTVQEIKYAIRILRTDPNYTILG